MRLYLKLSRNQQKVPFGYATNLVGALHKWIGINDLHNKISLYSFSWLEKAKVKDNALNFPNGSTWFISAHEEALLKKILNGILTDATVAFGMQVLDVSIQETPFLGKEAYFHAGSPIFVKKQVNGKQIHLRYDDPEANELLTTTLKTKLKAAHLAADGVRVCFDDAFGGAKTQLCHYRGVENKANLCPVVVQGSPEQVAFAWNVGVGNSTGIGFGSLIHS
jgi:CRISPR-associated endoribonuclease Cas6